MSDMPLIFSTQNPLVVKSGLIGYWSLNDGSGTVARDFCGNTAFTNGVLTPNGSVNPSWIPGRSGAALRFNLTNYVNIADSAYLRPGVGDWSMCAWFQGENVNQTRPIIFKRNSASPFTQIGIQSGYVDNSGNGVSTKQICLFNYGNGSFDGVHTNNDFCDGNWHHVVAMRIGSSGAGVIYVDGINQAITVDAGPAVNNINNTDPWQIGYASGVGAAGWSGSIDCVRIYNRILTASEISSIYSSGT